MNHLVKRIKQIIARIEYYGPKYIFEYINSMTGKRGAFTSVLKKEATYKYLNRQDYIIELAKWYYASTGEHINFQHPETFNQKLQWCKVYDSNPLKTKLADKYLVREWVKEKIGEKYLVPLLGVWDKFDDIDFFGLPDRFVLKCNHGSGWNIIIEDKSSLDMKSAKDKIDLWMSENFAYKAGFELHYKNIVPKIIAEEYMENFEGDIYDYKFYCFDGKVHFIHFLMGRKSELVMAYYDRNWIKQNFVHNHQMIKDEIAKPDNLDEMTILAEKLSDGFPYVRVDFYRLNDGTIKFGEMTFTPASGTQDWNPPEANKMLGDLFNLPVCKEVMK